MKDKPLSERQCVLLHLVAKNTERDWSTGKLERFFVPQPDAYYYFDSGRMCSKYISGAGDAAALKGLESRGLIERPKTTLPNDYIYALTEDGLQYLEQSGLRERFDETSHDNSTECDDD